MSDTPSYPLFDGRTEYREVKDGRVEWGNFGTVRPVERILDGKVLARKTIPFAMAKYGSEENFTKRVKGEVAQLYLLDHPGIVRFYDAIFKVTEVEIYTEWLESRNLDSYIKDHYTRPEWPPELEAWSFVTQISGALAYCQEGLLRARGCRTTSFLYTEDWVPIIHRDIKPWNILVQVDGKTRQEIFKLCDFGLGAFLHPDANSQLSYGGTPSYIPPEVTRDNPDWTQKGDVWCFGAVLYYFYKRNAPFNYQLTNDSDQMDSLPDHASEEIKKLVKDCLAFDKTNRPDAKSIFRQSLAHITEKERMLASVEILTSSSEAEARETTSSVSAKDSATPWSADKKPLVDKLSKDQKNTAQPALSTSEKEPTVPAVNLWAERAKKQKSANREKAGGDDMTTSLRPLGAGGPPSDIRERIGSLVIDYERLTPREVFMPSIPFSAKKIEMELLAEDFQYDNSFVQPESGPSRSSSRLDFLRPTLRHSSTSTEVSISIKADNCEEFYLSNSEEYFKTLLLRKEIENWIYRQDQMGKTVYLVVGYICYQNALVEEASAHERTETMGAKSQISSENSAMAALSPPAHTTASLSTSSSASDNRLSRRFTKRGTHRQAVDVRPIIVTPEYVRDYTLGNMMTAYFWGPKSRPFDD